VDKAADDAIREADNYLISATGTGPEIERISESFIGKVLKDTPVSIVSLDDEIDELMETRDEWLLDVTRQFILKDARVVCREMTELELAGLNDPFFPNTWLYHRDMPMDVVRRFILDQYDSFQAMDAEEEHDTMR
jgi:hypothetical protein